MGLMDKMKAQANQIAVQANASVTKLEPVNRRADQLLRSLGLALYAERTGRGNPRTAAEMDSLVAQIQQHEAQNRVDVVQQAVQAANQANAAAAAVVAANQPPPPPPPGSPGYGAPQPYPGPGGQPGFAGVPPQPGSFQPQGPQGPPPGGQPGFPGQAGGYPGQAPPPFEPPPPFPQQQQPFPQPQGQPLGPGQAAPAYVPTQMAAPEQMAPPTVLAADAQPGGQDAPESDIIP